MPVITAKLGTGEIYTFHLCSFQRAAEHPTDFVCVNIFIVCVHSSEEKEGSAAGPDLQHTTLLLFLTEMS